MKVKLVNWPKQEVDGELVLSSIQSLGPIEFVDSIEDATLVICSYHGLVEEHAKWWTHRVPYVRRFVAKTKRSIRLTPKQTSLFVSAECPVWSRFTQSSCDFGISHEFLPGCDNHLRLPYWYQSIDWSDSGVTHNSSKRTGIKIKPEYLCCEREIPDWATNDEIIMITSHLNGFKSGFYRDLSREFAVNLVGNAGGGAVVAKKTAVEMGGYLYSACPENLVCPGYYTEKTLEAWVCGSIPVTCHDELSVHDFSPDAYVNLYRRISDGIGPALREFVSNKARVKEMYSRPLFAAPPSIDKLKDFLSLVLSSATAKAA